MEFLFYLPKQLKDFRLDEMQNSHVTKITQGLRSKENISLIGRIFLRNIFGNLLFFQEQDRTYLFKFFFLITLNKL